MGCLTIDGAEIVPAKRAHSRVAAHFIIRAEYHVPVAFDVLGEPSDHRSGLNARMGVDALSGGEQQMLVIARALMGAPKLLLVDEPSEGLAPKIVVEVFGAIRRMCSEGISIVLVEQNVRGALDVVDRCYIVERGRALRRPARYRGRFGSVQRYTGCFSIDQAAMFVSAFR